MSRLRVIAGRPIAEPEKPKDAVEFADRAALVFFALLALAGLWALAILILSLEKLAP